MKKLMSTMFAAAGLSVASVTASVLLFSSVAMAQEVKGDAKAGATKIDLCLGCHGILEYRGSFPEVYRVPELSGQNAKYLSNALHAYKKGDRKHPTMRSVAGPLTDQDIADIAAYYSQHGKDSGAQPLPDKPVTEPSAQVAALLQKGVCISCHGANLSKPIDPSYPKLAGQHPDYLYAALRAYKTENNPLIGRSQAIMSGVVKQFSNTELKALATYIGSLDGQLSTQPESRFR
jgi:cytochrome c553